MADYSKASIQVRIPFHDVDSMRICWHGNYYKYFEMARTELLKTLDMDLFDTERDGIVLPVIRSQCKYIIPLQYNQLVNVSAFITEIEYKLVIQYVITDATTLKVHAKGTTEHAAVHSQTYETFMPMPLQLVNRLKGKSDHE